MKPYYSDDLVTIYHGRAEGVVPTLDLSEAAVIADPPYGIDWDPNGGRSRRRKRLGERIEAIEGDGTPFEPGWLLRLGRPLILWGANHYASRLPDSPMWLVWDKRGRNGFHVDQADCELAWTNLPGPARAFRHVWHGGGSLARENGVSREGVSRTIHPNQKPVALMGWCIGLTTAPVIVDPYTGSGSTLVAAKRVGRRSIGVETRESWCETAANRCRQEVLGLTA